MKTVLELLTLTSDYFAKKGIPSPRLDAEVLMAYLIGKDRVGVYCSYDQPLQDPEIDRFRDLVRRRINREPVAYIIGKKEFFGRDFLVTPAVLIPRPDTETLVETALELLKSQTAPAICDVGTGSGCIGLTLLKQHPTATLFATDISPDAAAIARQNADMLELSDRVEIATGPYFAGTDQTFDLIVSNPPYIPLGDKPTLAPEITEFEPQQALYGGDDGLDIIRELIAQSLIRIRPGGSLLIEIGAGQAENVLALLEKTATFGSVKAFRDLAGTKRVAAGLIKHE